jgi:hypothetical protein
MDVDKCIGCCYYDRQHGNNTDSRGVSWGQCRRTAPALHPINQKSFMIEGVWPHVRDDDWCGEFKSSPRRPEPRVSVDALGQGPLLSIGAGSTLGTRASNVASFASTIASRDDPPVTLGPLASTGRGND